MGICDDSFNVLDNLGTQLGISGRTVDLVVNVSLNPGTRFHLCLVNNLCLVLSVLVLLYWLRMRRTNVNAHIAAQVIICLGGPFQDMVAYQTGFRQM